MSGGPYMTPAQEVWEQVRDQLGPNGVYSSATWSRSECPEFSEASTEFVWAPRLARRRLITLALHRARTNEISIVQAVEELMNDAGPTRAAIKSQYPLSVITWVQQCGPLERALLSSVVLSGAINAHRILPPLPEPIAVQESLTRKVGPSPATGLVKVQWDLVCGPRSGRTLVRIGSGPLSPAYDLLVDAIAYIAVSQGWVEQVIEVCPDSGETQTLPIDAAATGAAIPELLRRAVGVPDRIPLRVGGPWCVWCWTQDICEDAPSVRSQMGKPHPEVSPPTEM